MDHPVYTNKNFKVKDPNKIKRNRAMEIIFNSGYEKGKKENLHIVLILAITIIVLFTIIIC